MTDAEWAFRIHKDELAIRPVWHHKEECVRAHILVRSLAYVLWKALGQWMRQSRLGEAPRRRLAHGTPAFRAASGSIFFRASRARN